MYIIFLKQLFTNKTQTLHFIKKFIKVFDATEKYYNLYDNYNFRKMPNSALPHYNLQHFAKLN